MTTPLAASLGRLGAAPSQGAFEGVRLTLLDTLLDGRRADVASHAPWQRAWDDAATGLRDVVIAEARRAMLVAAQRSHYPTRRLAALDPDAETADILKQRLLAEGMPLERFEGAAVDAATDRARAAVLEEAWDGAVRIAAGDIARWRGVAQQVSAWRRPMRAYWSVIALLTLAVVVIAAWLGGQLDAPAWFRPMHDWWWSLPWP